tara:strand:- start:8026 stop:9417 length:1392 start_codon:yes stop_codon:yes gene_type:complete
MAVDFALPNTFETDAAAAIDAVLTQEANRIGADIHKATLHTSPWIDLIKQSTFPEGMGYQLSTLIYDRALPLQAEGKNLAGTDSVGVGSNWRAMGTTHGTSVNGMSAGQLDQTGNVLGGSVADDFHYGSGAASGDVNLIDFTKSLKTYSLERSIIESPRINVEELRYTAHRTEQLRAIMDLLKESTRNSWESRYRDEYGKMCDNIVYAKTASSVTVGGKEGVALTDLDVDDTSEGTAGGAASGDGAEDNVLDVTANISNKLLDDIYFKLVRAGAGSNAYGRENGRPVFSIVCSSEASYQLMTEAGFRDDVRYNNAKVSDLIAPLGVEKSFRGFYHLIDDLAPRFSGINSDKLVAVQPYKHDQTNDKITVNGDYDTAAYEAAFILVDNVMESLIPAPITNVSGMSFNPVNYKGDFKWTNIPDVVKNPDGTIGFFRGIMASASKPIKTNFGYVILFKRTSTTPAA